MNGRELLNRTADALSVHEGAAESSLGSFLG